MWANYFTVAWRHFAKNRLFSLINVLGLAIGLMSCILILIFMRAESGYDQWIPDHDRVVRLHSKFFPTGDNPPFITVRSAGRMKDAVMDQVAPDLLEGGVRLIENSPTVTPAGSNETFAASVTFADGTFFDILDLPFAHGNAETSFRKPLDIILTEQSAIRFFGRIDVVGETLSFCCANGRTMELAVKGVLRDLPQETHLNIEILAYLEPQIFADNPNVLDTWTSVNVYSYFKLKDGARIEDLQQRLLNWLDSESSPFFPFLERLGIPEGKVTDLFQPNFMKVADIYLKGRADVGNIGDMRPLGDINQIYMFGAVAVLILLIAGINFTNLSTARATRRAREVAMRKVLGASRKQVASQFLIEAVTLALAALLLALVGVELAMPSYSEMLGREIIFSLIDDAAMVLPIFAGTVLVGLIAGLYPAAVLSRFMPARILRANQSSDGGASSAMRSVLVVFQFAISIGLAICTSVIYSQTDFARNIETGYSVENKVAVGLAAAGEVDLELMAREMERLPGVTSAVLSSEVPSQDRNNNTYFQILGTDTAQSLSEPVVLNYHSVGYGFMEAYDIDLLAGRFFDEAYGTDLLVGEEEQRDGDAAEDRPQRYASMIINETAVRMMGFNKAEEAVGRIARSGGVDYTIIGVIPDLYFRSIRFGVRGSAYRLIPDRYNEITVSFNSSNLSAMVAAIEQKWAQVAPQVPMSLAYVDELVANQYAREEGEAQLFASFAILAVIVAALGLYGLASFAAERRTKEMGIRKVMGASVGDIVRLMVWQFSKPVLIANLIAWPGAWFVMQHWLSQFEYRIDSSIILIAAAIAGGVALVVAWGTVAGRAMSVANRNPVHVLRYE